MPGHHHPGCGLIRSHALPRPGSSLSEPGVEKKRPSSPPKYKKKVPKFCDRKPGIKKAQTTWAGWNKAADCLDSARDGVHFSALRRRPAHRARLSRLLLRDLMAQTRCWMALGAGRAAPTLGRWHGWLNPKRNLTNPGRGGWSESPGGSGRGRHPGWGGGPVPRSKTKSITFQTTVTPSRPRRVEVPNPWHPPTNPLTRRPTLLMVGELGWLRTHCKFSLLEQSAPRPVGF